jgi:hypothetical protein
MLAGIYVWAAYAVQFVFLIAQLFPMLEAGGLFALWFSIGGPLLVAAVVAWIGYVFIFRASVLARHVAPEDTGNEPAFPWKCHDVQAVAISILGIFLCVGAFSRLGLIAMQSLFLPEDTMGDVMSNVTNYLVRDAVTQAFRLTMGLFLFFKASALASFWRRSQEPSISNTEA